MTNGLVVMTPTSISYSGTSASINVDGSVDFSALTNLTLNGVFTGDYDNYMVSMKQLGNTTGQRTQMKFTNSGTPQSSTYTVEFLNADGATVSAGRQTIYGRFANQIQTLWSGVTVYIFGPYLLQPTAWRTVDMYADSGARIVDASGTYPDSASHDGMYLVTSSGTVTGKLTVFGFNQ